MSKKKKNNPVKFFRLILLSFLLLFISPPDIYSKEQAGNSLASYTGMTGLLDMPTARIMPDWSMRGHYSWADPYYTFGVAATLLPWLEANGRIIGISGLPALSEGYGDAKDKALDCKIRLLEESDIWPAVAVGFNDIHGTALFASRYLAMSKLLGPVDLTIGAGQGILAGESTAGRGSAGDASDDAGFDFLTSGLTENDTKVFGGAELRVTENLSLLAEYSSIDYEILQGAEQTEPPESPCNFAVKYRLAKNSLLSASYLRGNVFGFSLAADFPLKPEGILPWKVQPFWVPSEELKQKASEASNEELAFILRHEVAAEKFSNVRTSVGDASVWVEIENPTYLSNTKAIGRALRAVCAIVPSRIHWIYVSLKSKDIILLTIKIGREDFEAYIDGRMDAAGLLEFVEFNNEGNEQRDVFLQKEDGASALTASYGSKKLKFGMKPSWKTYFNDPSGFLKHRFSLSWNAGYYPWAGGFLKASIRTPLYNGITGISRTTETNPVRTDTAEYLSGKDIRLEQLAFDQVFNLPFGLLSRAEVGLFESAYGGLGGEVFRFFQNGRFGVGLEGECVWKREPDHDLKFKDSASYKTAFLNLYYNLVPELGIDLGLKLGRFLGGDKGGRLDMSRTFRHFTMGAWYTITDTDVFTASYNKDYHDKGIYLRIPFSLFTDSDDSKKLNYSFRPWGRDTGQTVTQINSLYPMAVRGSIKDFKQTIEELKD